MKSRELLLFLFFIPKCVETVLKVELCLNLVAGIFISIRKCFSVTSCDTKTPLREVAPPPNLICHIPKTHRCSTSILM